MKTKFNYMLRRTLPLWNWEKIAAETIKRCKENHIKEIIWMIDPEDFTHGLPTLELIKSYVDVLAKVKQMQEKENIVFSLNPWVTLGHAERGRDMRSVHSSITWMTDENGYHSKAVACPLSNAWQEWLCGAYALYASLKPNILWLEDDFRHFNHERIRFGCFCENHLEEFKKRTGTKYTREELLKTLLHEGEPHPHRGEWLNMNGGIMVDVMAKVEKTVHKISPRTSLALMCSGPETHSLEGRQWHKLAATMAGETNMSVFRPSMGSYNEWHPLDVIAGMDCTRLTMAQLPQNALICPELESCFYSLYAKSARHTRLQAGLAAIVGAKNLTMNIFDFIGGNIEENDPFLQALNEVKPQLDALASFWEQHEDVDETVNLGVGIAFSQNAPSFAHIKNANTMHDLDAASVGWAVPLQASGITVNFNAQNPCMAVTGHYFYSQSKEKIEEMLSNSLLLDASAALCLQDMGYGEYLGVEIDDLIFKDEHPLGGEEFHNAAFGGKDGLYMSIISVNKNGLFADMRKDKETQLISSITNPDRQRTMPCMTAFENSLGGRVVVYAADFSKGLADGIRTGFLNDVRAKQLANVICWLKENVAGAGLQTISGAYQYIVAHNFTDFVYVGLANLSTDLCENICVQFLNTKVKITKVELLSNGIWTDCEFEQQGNIINVHSPLPYKDFTALKFYKVPPLCNAVLI